VIGQWIMPLTREWQWGYTIPYMITGILNQHPSSAMAWLDADDKEADDYIRFYDKVTEDDRPT
jgi:4-hydroxy 2-oxovalerate aldolase